MWDVEDFEEYLLIKFKWSKSIQKGERVLELPIIKLSGSSLCPVDGYRKMCLEIPSSNEDDALFLLPSKTDITYLQFQTKLRDCIGKIGLDPKLYSTHSFRRGMSTLAFQAGIHPDKIKLLGDWKSE